MGDAAFLYLALAVTVLIRYGAGEFTLRLNDHLVPFSIIFILWIAVLYLFNLYQYKVNKTANLLRDIFTAVAVATLISIAAFYFFPEFFQLTPKLNMLIFGAVFFVLKYAWQNLVLFRIFTSGTEKIIVVGNSPLIAKTAIYIKDNPHIGYSVEAWFDDPERLDFDVLTEKIKETGARLIVIQDHITRKLATSQLIYKLLAHEVNVINFWNFYEILFDKVPLEELEEGWFIENVATHRPLYKTAKRLVDILLSSLLLIIFSPLMLLSAVAIKLSSKGPIIFKQERSGKDEKPFVLYKFRTMRDGSEGPLWTEKNDKRITWIGKILRRTHLDELPQFFNILKGDLSLIGPRAEAIELVKKYSEIPYYDIRHIIKPGLTGWAQLNFKQSTSLEEAKEKLCYDIYYIKNRSIFLDLLIAFKTIRYFFTPNE